jgi:hypothetical protein
MVKIDSSCFIFLLLLLSGNRLLAQDNTAMNLDRPDQTESVFTVPANHFQMENGFLFEKSKNDISTVYSPSVLIKYGLSERFEAGVITEFIRVGDGQAKQSGILPVTLRMKQSITGGHGIIPATSFIGYLSLPQLASDDFKATYYAPAFRFTMQHTLSDAVSLGYNLGAQWDGEVAEPEFLYTLSLAFTISGKTGAYAEVYGYAPQESKADHRVDGGFTYLLLPNIIVDLSGGAGISNSTLKSYVAFGVSFRLPD